MPRELIPIVLFIVGGLVGLAVSPIGQAIAKRIAGGGGGDVEALRGDVADLRAELDARLGQLDEMQERLDFTERALAQVKAQGTLPGGR